MSAGRRTRKQREDALALLRHAGALVHKRSGWTKRALARDRHSHPVMPDSARAVRWCFDGALIRAGVDLFDYTVEFAGKPECWVMLAPLELEGSARKRTSKQREEGR